MENIELYDLLVKRNKLKIEKDVWLSYVWRWEEMHIESDYSREENIKLLYKQIELLKKRDTTRDKKELKIISKNLRKYEKDSADFRKTILNERELKEYYIELRKDNGLKEYFIQLENDIKKIIK